VTVTVTVTVSGLTLLKSRRQLLTMSHRSSAALILLMNALVKV
jgi:hypothetical protein